MRCGFGWIKEAKYAQTRNTPQFEIRDEDGDFASGLGHNM